MIGVKELFHDLDNSYKVKFGDDSKIYIEGKGVFISILMMGLLFLSLMCFIHHVLGLMSCVLADRIIKGVNFFFIQVY